MPEADTPNNGEREFETGLDEFFKFQSQNTSNNAKRTADEYQDLSLTFARQQATVFANAQALLQQHMQNAISNANFAAKSYLEHNNLAHDSYWNPVAAGAGMNLTAGSVPANRATDVAAAATATDTAAVLSEMVRLMSTMTASMANVIAQAQPKYPTTPTGGAQ